MRRRMIGTLISVAVLIATVMVGGVGPVAAVSDSGRPPVPSNLTVIGGGSGGATPTLSWAPSEGAVEYAIWRNGGWYSWVKAPTTTWSDTKPVDGARYQLRALGADGSWSQWTNPVSLTDLDGPPAVPTGLTATIRGAGVDLSWASSEGAVEYAIWRNGGWYGWVKAPATTWSDTKPVDGARYQLRALGADRSWSQWTNPVTPVDTTVSGDTDTTAPSPIVDPRVIGKRPGDYVEIDWLPATDDTGIDHYRIDYIDGAGIDDFTDTTTETTYRIDDDSIATFAVAYDHFIITAIDVAGNQSEPTELWFTYDGVHGDPNLGYTPERNAAARPADPVSLTAGPPDVNDFNGPGENYQAAVVTLKLPFVPDNFASGVRLYRNGELLSSGSGYASECRGPDCDFQPGIADLLNCLGTDCVRMFIDNTAVPGETYTYRVVGWDRYNESRNGVEITYTVPVPDGQG